MLDVVAGDSITSCTPENSRKPDMVDASRRARALLGSLKEKRDFFESRIHVGNNVTVQQKADLGDFPAVHCPSPTKSSFSFSDMTTTLGSKIQERQNMINRLTGSPNGSFRTANTQETTASTLSPFTSKERTVILKVPPAPSLNDIEESIKEELCVVIPVRDQSPSPELSISWLDDSCDTQQQVNQKLNSGVSCYPDVFPATISAKVSCENDHSSHLPEISRQRYAAFFPSTIPLHETPGLANGQESYSANTIPPAISSKNTAFIQSTKLSAWEQSVAANSDRLSRNDGVSRKKPEKLPLPGKANVSNREKSSTTKDAKKETHRLPNKPPRPSRRGSRSKRTIKDRRKTEIALSAAAVLLEPASSFEDHCDTYSISSLKSADVPANDYLAAGLKPPVLKEKKKIEKIAKRGLKVSPCETRPTRYVKQCDPRPSKAKTRSVSFVLPDEANNGERNSACSTSVPLGKGITKQSHTDSKDFHFISQNDAEMVPIVELAKGGVSQNRSKEKPPVVLLQYSEDSQEDRNSFLKSVYNTHGPLNVLKSKKDITRVSVHVDRFGIMRKRFSNTIDDSSMDFTSSDSNSSGWMSSSGSVNAAVSRAAVEDLSDIDVVIEKRHPRVNVPLVTSQTSKHIDVVIENSSPRVSSPSVSPQTSKQRVVYSAKLVSNPVPAPDLVSIPKELHENDCVPGGLLMPELDDRCHRKNKHRIPILLRPLVFASENQSDALSHCYGGMYSISSESIVEKRIRAFERKIKAGKYVPRFQPISKDFPCATRGSLYDIAVHSGCMMDQEKLTPRPESKRKENPAKGGLYYLALSSGLSRNSIESRCSYTIFTKNSTCSVVESNGEVISENVSDERCGASGSLYLANATLSSFE